MAQATGNSKTRRKAFKAVVLSKNKKLQCQYCDKSLTYETATIDHFYPTDCGGPDKFHNYRISCNNCNYTKGNEIHTFDPGCLLTYTEIQILELVGKTNFVTMIEKYLI